MTIAHSTRLALRRLGLDLARYPGSSPDRLLHEVLVASAPDVVLDVGANAGGFARQCRSFGYRGLIVSFEPGQRAFARLAVAAARDPLWRTERLALGREPEVRELHVAGNDGASSSLLPMLSAHVQGAPEAVFVSNESVQVETLDRWFDANGSDWASAALKVDTQGFERQVLGGSTRVLEILSAIQIEMSLVPLYEGSWPWREAVDWLANHGFVLAGVNPGFFDYSASRMLQFDGVFVRC